MKQIIYIGALFFICLTSQPTLSQNILQNPGFENWSNDTFLNSWRENFPYSQNFSPIRITSDSTPKPIQGNYAIEMKAKGGLSSWVRQKIACNQIPDSFSINYYYRGHDSGKANDLIGLNIYTFKYNGNSEDTIWSKKFTSTFINIDTPFQTWKNYTYRCYDHPNIAPDSLEIYIIFSGLGDRQKEVYLILDSALFTTKPLNTSLSFKNLNMDMLVYPNPSIDYITISCIQNTDKLNIYNMQGKLVKSVTNTIENKTLTLDISYLPSGIYYVQNLGNNNQMNLYFVKK